MNEPGALYLPAPKEGIIPEAGNLFFFNDLTATRDWDLVIGFLRPRAARGN